MFGPIVCICGDDVKRTLLFQIARELRLRDIGGIIVVDFIDMIDDGKLKSLQLCYLNALYIS